MTDSDNCSLKASGTKMIVGIVLTVVMVSVSLLTMAAEKDIMTPRVSPKEIEISEGPERIPSLDERNDRHR